MRHLPPLKLNCINITVCPVVTYCYFATLDERRLLHSLRDCDLPWLSCPIAFHPWKLSCITFRWAGNLNTHHYFTTLDRVVILARSKTVVCADQSPRRCSEHHRFADVETAVCVMTRHPQDDELDLARRSTSPSTPRSSPALTLRSRL